LTKAINLTVKYRPHPGALKTQVEAAYPGKE
jgi:hypothetical protein